MPIAKKVLEARSLSDRATLLCGNFLEGDSFAGLKNRYDLIYVTFEVRPEDLVHHFQALNPNGGVLIAPVKDDRYDHTALRVYRRDEGINHTDIASVNFVPAVRPK